MILFDLFFLSILQNTKIPVLISVVANQSLQLSERTWRHLLYGLSHEETKECTKLDTRHFGGWFQDPFRTFVSGVLRLEHSTQTKVGIPCFDSITFSNPWCEFSTIQSTLPLPAYRYSKISTAEESSPFSKACWTLRKENAPLRK